jgi:16S rRNA (cytosine967-C5)-methyltransferase
LKIHSLILDQVCAAIKDIFSSHRHADKVIEFYLKKNKKWGSRDRRFFAETVYDLVRWWRLYWYLAGFDDNTYRDGEKMTPNQIRRIWAIYHFMKHEDKPPWEEFDGLSLDNLQRKQMAIKNPAIRHAFPDDLYQLGEKEYGKEWEKIAQSLNKPADVYLRANTLKTEVKPLLNELNGEGIHGETVPDAPHAIKLKERKNVFITDCFKKGLFEVQDLASQQIAPMLQVEPGMRVIDACAGAGGKSLHLAALMKNKGKIIAMDVNQRKLDELRKRSSRNGVDIIETKLIEGSKSIKRLEKTADRVLLDVPCSGFGVLRRNPDTKWKLTLEEIDKLRALQAEILRDYSTMTKPGGFLVYATCSLLPSENDAQVSQFLSQAGDVWTLIEDVHWRPDIQGADGFYGALLRRNI